MPGRTGPGPIVVAAAALAAGVVVAGAARAVADARPTVAEDAAYCVFNVEQLLAEDPSIEDALPRGL